MHLARRDLSVGGARRIPDQRLHSRHGEGPADRSRAPGEGRRFGRRCRRAAAPRSEGSRPRRGREAQQQVVRDRRVRPDGTLRTTVIALLSEAPAALPVSVARAVADRRVGAARVRAGEHEREIGEGRRDGEVRRRRASDRSGRRAGDLERAAAEAGEAAGRQREGVGGGVRAPGRRRYRSRRPPSRTPGRRSWATGRPGPRRRERSHSLLDLVAGGGADVAHLARQGSPCRWTAWSRRCTRSISRSSGSPRERGGACGPMSSAHGRELLPSGWTAAVDGLAIGRARGRARSGFVKAGVRSSHEGASAELHSSFPHSHLQRVLWGTRDSDCESHSR